MTTIFLTHAAADRGRALALAGGLRSAGFTLPAEPPPAGDTGWWAAILAAVQDADLLLYATSPQPERATGEATVVVAALRDYAVAIGIPTLEVHLSGGGPATALDFRHPTANTAFRLVGAIAALPPRPPVVAWQASPESPFARVADLARDLQATTLAPSAQRALVDRLRAAAGDQAVPELAAVLRLRPDLDAETARHLDEAFPATDPGTAEPAAGGIGAPGSGTSGSGTSGSGTSGSGAGGFGAGGVDATGPWAGGSGVSGSGASGFGVAGSAVGGVGASGVGAGGSGADGMGAGRSGAGGFGAGGVDAAGPWAGRVGAGGTAESGVGAGGSGAGGSGAAGSAEGGSGAGGVGAGGSGAGGSGAGGSGGAAWAPAGGLTADDVGRIQFRKAPFGRRGYDEEQVDVFLDKVESDLRARHAGGPVVRVLLTAADVHEVSFVRPPFGKRGYDEEEVDAFLDEVERAIAALDQALAARGSTVSKS